MAIEVTRMGKPLPRGTVTFEQFHDWLDEVAAEWVGGEIVPMSPEHDWHNHLTGWLCTVLRLYVRTNRLGDVFISRYLVRLRRVQQAREPDLVYLRRDHEARNRGTYIDGAPDTVVEIVSPESAERDRKDKFEAYQAEGIPEYWLIDPTLQEAIFYRLDEAGAYQPVALDAAGRFASEAVPGFWLKPAWLWQKPLPDELDVLRALGR